MVGVKIALSFDNSVDNMVDGLRGTAQKIFVVCGNKDKLSKVDHIIKRQGIPRFF